MRTIRGSLTLWLVSAGVLLGALAAAICYARTSAALGADFDRTLLAQATALGAAVHREPEGTLAVIDAAVPRGRHAGRFQIRDAAGRTLLRSGTPRGSKPGDATDVAVPESAAPVHFWTVKAPGRRPTRAVRVRFLPGLEVEPGVPPAATAADAAAAVTTSAPSAAPATAAAGDPHVTLVLEQDLSPVRRMERLFLGSLGLALAGLCAGVAVVVPLVVGRGLASLDKLAEQARGIEASTLGTRFDAAAVPAELRPICGRLNDLLARLDEAFRRERRFTANVAHELRTPVAELRAMAEVALRWPPDAAGAAAGFADVRAVALRMEAVVAALLSLARAEPGTARPADVSVDLSAVVADAWRAYASRAAARGVAAAFNLPPAAVVSSDPTLLRTVVGNLLSNAANYCPPGGLVTCAVRATADAVELTVANPAGNLTAADLPMVTEAFWRKDAAGTDAAHAGLGLSLVAGYAKVLGATFDVALADDGQFVARLRMALDDVVRARAARPAELSGRAS
jgi:signal transduction histidine kinase